MSIPAPCLLALWVPHLGLALACHWLCHPLARDPAILSVLLVSLQPHSSQLWSISIPVIIIVGCPSISHTPPTYSNRLNSWELRAFKGG